MKFKFTDRRFLRDGQMDIKVVAYVGSTGMPSSSSLGRVSIYPSPRAPRIGHTMDIKKKAAIALPAVLIAVDASCGPHISEHHLLNCKNQARLYSSAD